MSMQFSSGTFHPKNPKKYIGRGSIRWRSSWEYSVMLMLDGNDAIVNWASESIKIPYRDPLTGKPTVYVPDFLVMYIDNNKQKHVEVWEIKPANQTFKESVGKNPYNQAQWVKNMVKWEAAKNWCKQNGMVFKILTEKDLFHNPKGKRK